MSAQEIPQEPEPGSLVPPRPNLGPEPWPLERGWSSWIAPGLVFGLLLGVFAILKRRRSRRKNANLSTNQEEANREEPTPRQLLISASEQVREALFRAFGPAWQSKTTEEISHHRGLKERLDPTDFDRLIAFLRLADRAKFAENQPEAVEDWEIWASSIVQKLTTPPESRRITPPR